MAESNSNAKILWQSDGGTFSTELHVEEIKRIFFRTLGISLLHDPECPDCGEPILHIHRTFFDRIVSIFIPQTQRFACSNQSCDWESKVLFR